MIILMINCLFSNIFRGGGREATQWIETVAEAFWLYYSSSYH